MIGNKNWITIACKGLLAAPGRLNFMCFKGCKALDYSIKSKFDNNSSIKEIIND